MTPVSEFRDGSDTKRVGALGRVDARNRRIGAILTGSVRPAASSRDGQLAASATANRHVTRVRSVTV